jgi:hypothetical protein
MVPCVGSVKGEPKPIMTLSELVKPGCIRLPLATSKRCEGWASAQFLSLDDFWEKGGRMDAMQFIVVLAVILLLGLLTKQALDRRGGVKLTGEIITVPVTVKWSMEGEAFSETNNHLVNLKQQFRHKWNRQAGVLIFGIGHSGKTELIRALTEQPIPAGRTEKFEVYRHVSSQSFSASSSSAPTSHAMDIVVPDYRGQNIGDFPRTLMADHLPKNPQSWQMIIIVVDPFGATDPKATELSMSLERIEEHTNYWHEGMIDIVFSFAEDNLYSYR